MADSILRDKAKEFAKAVVFLCREMKAQHKESVLINQLLRSATSVGANMHKEKKILFPNLKSPKKNVTKRNIG